jgi:uncharacterized protein with HEPN domain
MSRHDPLIRLRHMLRYARAAQRIATGRRREELHTDEDLVFLLVHTVGMVGEAASHVPQEVRAACPTIPWPVIVGTRHRLIHGYDQVNVDLLWSVVVDDVPFLIAELERILAAEGIDES